LQAQAFFALSHIFAFSCLSYPALVVKW
jgi:hypothetical protein